MFSCVFCCSGFLYIAFVSCYVFMLFVFDHDGPSLSSDSQLRFLPRILINSILVCTILWVEHGKTFLSSNKFLPYWKFTFILLLYHARFSGFLYMPFCIVLVFQAFCMMMLYCAMFSCFLYSTMMAPPYHWIPNCVIEQRFLPHLLIN